MTADHARAVERLPAATYAKGGSDRPVFAEERQERIARLVSVHGRVKTAELVDELGVTEPTLRKDLTALEQRRVLKRIHGGAIALRPSLETERTAREAVNAVAKDAIAKACVRELHDGDAVFLDSGTTVERIASHLRGRNLTVLTSAVAVAEAVCELPGVEHVLLGGRFRRVSGSLVGPLTLSSLAQFTVNVAFIGVSGFSDSGITVVDLNEAALKAAVIERARRVVVPLDASKVGATDFARVCDLDEVDTVVIDTASDEIHELCSSHDVSLRVAE